MKKISGILLLLVAFISFCFAMLHVLQGLKPQLAHKILLKLNMLGWLGPGGSRHIVSHSVIALLLLGVAFLSVFLAIRLFGNKTKKNSVSSGKITFNR